MMTIKRTVCGLLVVCLAGGAWLLLSRSGAGSGAADNGPGSVPSNPLRSGDQTPTTVAPPAVPTKTVDTGHDTAPKAVSDTTAPPVVGSLAPIKLTPTEAPTVEAAAGQHPLDACLAVAEKVLAHLKNDVKDYTCVIVKQERIGGELHPPEYMAAKIRQQPLSVYMKFLQPDDEKDREVIYVTGANGGNLLAHEGSGWRAAIGKVSLPPTGPLAMAGQRYPITELGLTRLTEKLIEVGQRDRKYGEVEVHFYTGAKVNQRACTLIEVVHPTPRRNFLFHIARIYIDDELKVPIRYAAYMWPDQPGGEPKLDECYTYLHLKLNQGLSDADFDYHNPSYHFVGK